MTIRSIQEQFEKVLPKASPTLGRAGAWLIQHIPEVAWNGLDTVASEAEVSPATMVRVIQLAGFHGYVDLQRAVRELVPSSSLAWRFFQKHPSQDANDTVSMVIADEKANLDQMGAMIRPQLETIWPWLLERQQILVVASLLTAGLAEHLALHLRLLLGNVDFVDAASSQAWLRIRDLRADDGVVAVSYPRYSEATRAVLTHARKRTNHIVLITDLTGPEHASAFLTIRLPSTSRTHYSSSVGLMALLQILSRGLAERSPDRVLGNIAQADRSWRELNMVKD